MESQQLPSEEMGHPVNISGNNLSEDSFGSWWLFRQCFVCLLSLQMLLRERGGQGAYAE